MVRGQEIGSGGYGYAWFWLESYNGQRSGDMQWRLWLCMVRVRVILWSEVRG